MRSLNLAALGVAAIMASACSEAPTSPASIEGLPELRFAHESNNGAQLTGTYTGTAIVNYVAGTEGWRSNVSLDGELVPGTYSYYATGGPGVKQLICSFTIVDADSRAGCSADTDLVGFTGASVEYEDETIVASGVFVRRGGKREKP